MRILSSVIVIVVSFASVSLGQVRYKDDIFSEVSQTTYTYFTKPSEELKIDVFQPVADNESDRPLLIYVHGGGFSGGKRDLPDHLEFCKTMAKKGYVTATMSYTLVMKGKSFGCDRPAPEKIETFLLTARDISRATKFMLDKQRDFRINPDKIVLLGSSAGAEAILHAAYWKATYKDESGTILAADFQYGGVVSMAGAITDIEWITTSNAIPSQFFHGTCDNLVPYDNAPHHYCTAENPGYLMLHGGHAIAEHLRALGDAYYLVTGCNGGHEWNITPIQNHMDLIVDFIYNDVISEAKRQSQNPNRCPDYHSFNFCQN